VSQWQMIKTMANPKQVVEDIAEMVIYELEQAGYRAKLVKHKRNISSWKIEPTDDLDAIQLKEFNKIKQEKTEEYKAMTKASIQNMRSRLK